MNLEYFVERLSTNRQVFEGLVKGASLEQARWKPSPDKWSIIEVTNHLYDEEREDFRQRLDLVLTDPEKPGRKLTLKIGSLRAGTTKEASTPRLTISSLSAKNLYPG